MASDSPARGATTAQLKHAIDSGGTGDKVAGLDPAASPLGTDDEAAGTPPSPEVIEAARRAESHRPASGPDKNQAPTRAESIAPDGHPRRPTWPVAVIAGAVAGLVLVAALLGGALLH